LQAVFIGPGGSFLLCDSGAHIFAALNPQAIGGRVDKNF
jgi:hypothetical protein